ncbi:hypothetical protein [uncultured Psychrobacillus sp.]|uniref:hypothetical protein n=1 Tax=uncultured Psychrobacillus sp. TaxID=1551585 RepID=UPI00261ADD25|nr:hypothetical protein [uncultured Psychrobacillus sp.]
MKKKIYDDYVLAHLKERNFKNIKELHIYINDYIFHCSEKYYRIQEKNYRMTVIDAYRYEVRLQEIDKYGALVLDGNDKVYGRRMNIDEFEEIAEVLEIEKKEVDE